MPPRPFDQQTQVLQPRLIVLALPRVPGKRRQPRQDCLQPYPVHARRRQPRQVSVRVRVQRGIEQRIAIEGEVGITVPRREGAGARRPARRRPWAVATVPSRTQTKAVPAPRPPLETPLRRTPAISRARAWLRASGGLVLQRLALRLQVAQLDEQEVVLAQRESHLLRRPAQELQELLVRQQVPVAAMTDSAERRCCSTVIRGGPFNPMLRPSRTISPALAPTTSPIRRAGTSCQLRHTNACSRSGKCGNATGFGALPCGRSAAVKPGFLAARRRLGPVFDQPTPRQPASSQCQGRRFKEGPAIQHPARLRLI